MSVPVEMNKTYRIIHLPVWVQLTSVSTETVEDQ